MIFNVSLMLPQKLTNEWSRIAQAYVLLGNLLTPVPCRFCICVPQKFRWPRALDFFKIQYSLHYQKDTPLHYGIVDKVWIVYNLLTL